MGSADQFVCVDGVMHECNTDAISVSQQTCTSQRHCNLGLHNGECAACIPEEDYRCREENLEVCDDTGRDYKLVEECPSADECNSESAACTEYACLADTYTCTQDDLLRGCNDDQSGFEDIEQCDPGLCDDAGGECDKCASGDKVCIDGNPANCNEEGQEYDIGECTGSKPICTGTGVCVQCADDEHCTDAPPMCNEYICDVGEGECVLNVVAGSPCQIIPGNVPGVCTDEGSCVQCISSGDCHDRPDQPVCRTSTGQCVQCLDSSHCSGRVGSPYCRTATNECVECVYGDAVYGDNVCTTTARCRKAYCVATNECATAIDEGASCGLSDVCNARGACVDCISDDQCNLRSAPRCDTDSYTCVQCTSDSHCVGSEDRCNQSTNSCVECTTSSHCSSEPVNKRCRTDNGTCVQCTTASHCGNPIDWECNNNSCVSIERCGNSVIEPNNNEQCDDPFNLGDNTCDSNCRFSSAYAACNDAYCTISGWNDGGACADFTGSGDRFCSPYCSYNTCPNVVGWDEVCIGTNCFIRCDSPGRICPIGYSCAVLEFGNEDYNICII